MAYKKPVVLDRFLIYATNKQIIIEPVVESEYRMVIDKENLSFSLKEIGDKKLTEVQTMKSTKIYGVLGTIQLLSVKFLIGVAETKVIGRLANKHDIHTITKVKLMPLNKAIQSEASYIEEYVKNLVDLLQSGDFYFSYTYDLTRSLQKRNQDKSKMKNAHDKIDKTFFWNRYISENLLKEIPSIENWIPILIYGKVTLRTCQTDDQLNSFHYFLISRRSAYRVGTRFRKRGIDLKGNVANYVEIEQIIETKNELSSYVIVRGSVPIFWMHCEEEHPLIFNPSIRLFHREEKRTLAATISHLDMLKKTFGHLHIVNLLSTSREEFDSDQQEQESILSDNYRLQVEVINDPNIKYTSFDFHAHCKNFDYEKLELFTDGICENDPSFTFFKKSLNKQNKSQKLLQKGLFRVNCLDSLDRTSVVQQTISKILVHLQLESMNILPKPNPQKENIEEFGDLKLAEGEFQKYSFFGLDCFRKNFNCLWGKTCDSISFQYAGTQALKGDFVKTGTRNVIGLLNDSLNSMGRYFEKIFVSEMKQFNYDLFLGNFSDEYKKKPMLSLQEQKSLQKKEAIKKCEKEICEISLRNEEIVFSCRLKFQKSEEKSIQKIIFCVTNCTVYIIGYSFNCEEILNCYSYPLKTVTSVLRDSLVTTKKTVFSSQKQLESLRLVNKFLITATPKTEHIVEKFLKENSVGDNYGGLYPTSFTPIDEDGLLSAFENTETTFTKSIEEKENYFVWPTLFSKKKDKIEKVIQILKDIKPNLIVHNNIE